MRVAQTIKFSIPPIVVVLGYMCAFAASSRGQADFLRVHFPLELIITAAFVGCIIAFFSLLPHRKSPNCRVPFYLNAVVLAAMVIWTIAGVIDVIVSWT